ncbi:MAG TPA: hypothetical protein VK137_04735 [Planctomycetaceae bacterium]|nr:hypothetical protein [Planctomycetaceae bacterium]
MLVTKLDLADYDYGWTSRRECRMAFTRLSGMSSGTSSAGSPVDLEKFLWLVKELKHLWLAEVILPHVEEVEAAPPPGALSSSGSLGLFGRG